MKGLVAYLLEHPIIGAVAVLALIAAALIGAAARPAMDGIVLYAETLPGAAPPAPIGEIPGYLSFPGDTGAIEMGSGTPAPDVPVADWILDSSAEDGTPAGTGPIADVLYSAGGQWCQNGRSYTNIQLVFPLIDDPFEPAAIPGMFENADCVLASFDEQTYTALVTCTPQNTEIAIYVFTAKEGPILFPGVDCDDGERPEEDSPPPARREPDCDDRKC